MPTIASSNIPTPKSWDEFEDIVLSAAKIRWSSPNFYRNGRQGQRQDGVDVFGSDASGQSIGLQCKNTVNGLSEALIKKEILNAGSFEPPLNALYIATTSPRDASLQKVVRKILQARIDAGDFTVYLLFWDDICNDLACNEDIFFKHYPQFAPRKDLPKEHDQRLYDEFICLLPSNGVIHFLEQTNMAGFSFPYSKLTPLREFYDECHQPEREFLNPQLEVIRQALCKKVDSYLNLIKTETFHVERTEGRISVPEEWEYEQPARFKRVVDTLHSLAGEIVEVHRSLIHTARAYFVGKT